MRARLPSPPDSLRRVPGRALTAGTLASVLVVATVAMAQPRGARTTAPRPVASAAASVAASGAEANPVPPPPGEHAGDGGTKASPLTPAPNEFSDAGLQAPSVDYDRLLADIGALRARAAAVGDVLFHSRLVVSLQASGEHARLASVAVALDDGTIYTAPAGFRAEDTTVVYDHAVAPGRHAVTVELERRDARDESFRSSQRSRFVVDVPADARLTFDLKLSDDSNMGADFPADKKGQYDLRVRAEARSQALAAGK